MNFLCFNEQYYDLLHVQLFKSVFAGHVLTSFFFSSQNELKLSLTKHLLLKHGSSSVMIVSVVTKWSVQSKFIAVPKKSSTCTQICWLLLSNIWKDVKKICIGAWECAFCLRFLSSPGWFVYPETVPLMSALVRQLDISLASCVKAIPSLLETDY